MLRKDAHLAEKKLAVNSTAEQRVASDSLFSGKTTNFAKMWLIMPTILKGWGGFYMVNVTDVMFVKFYREEE